MVSVPNLYNVKVITSVINTDQKAIVATTVMQFSDLKKKHIKLSFRRRSPDQHANVLTSLKDIQDDQFLNIEDP